MMKKSVALLLALLMCVSFASCGKKAAKEDAQPAPAESGQTETQKPAKPAPAAKYVEGDYTKALARELEQLTKGGTYRIGMKTGETADENIKNAEIMIYIDQDVQRMAADLTQQGTKMRMIFDNDVSYILFEDEKTAMKTSVTTEDIGVEDSLDEINDLSASDAEGKYTGGTAEINGVSYVWEQRAGDSGKIYFEKNTGVWKYVSDVDDGKEILTEITAYDANVDPSVFEVPSDYEIMDLTGMDVSDFIA